MKTLALLLCVACVRFPQTQPLVVPDTIHTTVGPIPIVLIDTLKVADSTMYVLGRFSYRNRTIYLRKEITDPIQRWKTLAHEHCHVIVIEAGLYNHIAPDIQELLCDAFASNRVAELLRGKP